MRKFKMSNYLQWLAGALIMVLALTPGAQAMQRILDSGYGVYDGFAIAVNIKGEVYTWGSNDYGQLGISNYTDKTTPQKVPGITNVIDVAAGANTAYALDADGRVWSWGRGYYGQLGNGSFYVNRNYPAKISGFTNIVDIEANGEHVMALDAEGYLYTWGYNAYGQLGLDDQGSRNTPQLVDIAPVATTIAWLCLPTAR